MQTKGVLTSYRCTWTWPNSSRCGQEAKFKVTTPSLNHERRPCARHLSSTVKQLDAIAGVGALNVTVL
jgi:hypothetical protein